MAINKTWEKLKYFKPDSAIDQWGDPELIDDTLLFMLDDFRNYIQTAIYVTRGVATSGHSDKSYHYPAQGACAVDVVIPGYRGGPINLILDAMRFGFTGIGYYPHWKYGSKPVGGLHLDVRPLKWEEDETLNYRHNRWVGIENTAYINDTLIKKQEYLPMNMENLIKYGRQYGHIKGDLVLDYGKLPGDLD